MNRIAGPGQRLERARVYRLGLDQMEPRAREHLPSEREPLPLIRAAVDDHPWRVPARLQQVQRVAHGLETVQGRQPGDAEPEMARYHPREIGHRAGHDAINPVTSALSNGEADAVADFIEAVRREA